MKNCLKWKPGNRVLCILSAIIFIILLIPLFRIAMYAIPWYDDYIYGIFVRDRLAENPTVFGALRGAAEAAAYKWNTWQGTYSSLFLMALVPFVWGEEYYFWGLWFIIALLVMSVFVLTKVLVRDVIRADRETCFIMQIFAATVVVLLIHSARAGFFWYNSGIYYVGMSSVLILTAAAELRLLVEELRRKQLCLAAILTALAFLLGGSNYVTALQGILMTASVICFGIYRHNKRTYLMLPAAIVYAAGFTLSAAAPGNAFRTKELEELGLGMDPVEAILRSLWEGMIQLWGFSGFFTIFMLLLAVPVIWQMVKKCRFSFRYPLLWCGWAFCLYSAGYTPSFYSLGEAGPERTVNAVKITYHVLLIITEVYWLGWLNRYLERKGKKEFDIKGYWWYYALILAAMFVCFVLTPYKAAEYSSYGAWSYLHSGDAAGFRQEYLERVEILKGPEKDVVLEPFHYYPRVLSVEDIKWEASAEPNRAMAAWFGKDSVRLREE